MLFMIIERFRDNDMLPIYKRVRDEGRSLPEGLKCRQLGGTKLRPLLSVDGMRRSAATPAMGAELARIGRDHGDRSRREQRGNPGSCGAIP